MEITISKSELQRALYVTQSIVERKTTMPILSNVLLSAKDGELKIASTDLEITAITHVTADVKKEGSITINAKIFGDIVRELPDGSLKLNSDAEQRLSIINDSTSVKIIGVSAEEFPSLPGLQLEPKEKVDTREFLEMINKTSYAVSLDETRFNLNGVCFEAGDGGLLMVATDGHRLSLIKRPLKIKFKESVIVPRKGLAELRKILENEEATQVGIAITEGFLLVLSSDTKISMRLVDGEFPDYQQVLPKSEGVVATVNAVSLSQALKRVALMVTDKTKCVKLDFSENSLRLSSSSPELGEAKEVIAISYKGEDLSVGFNANYIQQFISSLPENGDICIDLHGSLGPGKFYAKGDSSYYGIIMPMRLV